MSKLPVISGRTCVQALERAGFRLKRRTGSHRQAGLSVDEFVGLLK